MGRFEKKHPPPSNVAQSRVVIGRGEVWRQLWSGRRVAAGVKAVRAALTGGRQRVEPWIAHRAVLAAAGSCFSPRLLPLRPPWSSLSSLPTSRRFPTSASPWSSWDAGQSKRGHLPPLPPRLRVSTAARPQGPVFPSFPPGDRGDPPRLPPCEASRASSPLQARRSGAALLPPFN